MLLLLLIHYNRFILTLFTILTSITNLFIQIQGFELDKYEIIFAFRNDYIWLGERF